VSSTSVWNVALVPKHGSRMVNAWQNRLPPNASSPGPQPWETPDPLPVMRRELKLLLIEMNVLRVDAQ
jgi:hypothetical protein